MDIAPFLISEEFRLLLLENDADDVWNGYDKQVRAESSVAILISGYTGYATDTLIRFLDFLYTKENSESLLSFLDAVLVEHLKKTNSIKGLTELKERLEDMSLFSKARIQKMKVFKFKPQSMIRTPYLENNEANQKNNLKNIDPKKIFVVHGHDLISRDELVKMLEDRWNLEPIVLMDKPNQGKTVIEKFEDHSLKVGFAFVILTPDDLGGLKSDFEKNEKDFSKTLKPRARENVLLELGYFIGKLGRNKVCCLRKGEKLLPSDLHGIVDIPFTNSVKEIFLDIEKELKAVNYIK